MKSEAEKIWAIDALLVSREKAYGPAHNPGAAYFGLQFMVWGIEVMDGRPLIIFSILLLRLDGSCGPTLHGAINNSFHF